MCRIDFEPARHVIEGLGHLVADLAQRAAATGTGARCGMPQILSGQVFRQRAPRRLLRLGRGLDCRGDRRRCRREPLRLVGLQRLERQLELLGLARQLLRGTAELGPPITRQLEFQPGDLGLRGQRILRHRGDDALQRSEVVGQIVGRDRHARSGSDLQPFGRLNQWLSQFAAACARTKLSRPAPAARFAAASASRSPPAASTVAPGSAPPRPPRPAATRIGRAPGAWRTGTARRHPTTTA